MLRFTTPNSVRTVAARVPLPAWAGAALAMAGMLLASTAGGCATNPATGETILVGLSWQQEAALGAEAESEFIDQSGGLVQSPEAQRYVETIGRKLVQGVEEGVPELEWEFHLLDTDDVNAFALPGGKVFFTRGLASRLTSEAQMAGVLGHEIGHVTARHGNQRITQANLAQVGIGLLGIGIQVAAGSASEDGSTFSTIGQLAIPALEIGGQVVLLRYGREQELEADMLGMRYMARAGYHPDGQRDVMQVLAQLSAGAGRPIEFLSTHPYPETRIEQINRLLATEYQGFSPPEGDGRFTQRYQSDFLRQLPRATSSADHGGRSGVLPAVLWCAHCAEASAS